MRTTVAARLCRPFLGFGAEARTILARHALTPSDLDGAEARVDYDVMLELLDAAARVVGDERIGLQGAQSDAGTLRVLEYLTRTSVTAYDALAKAARYQNLLHDACELRIERQPDYVIARPGCRAGLRYPPPIVEFFTTSLFLALRKLQVPLDGAAVFFSHPAPSDTSEHESLLRVPVHFGAASSYARFPAAALDRPLPDADPALAAVLERHADRLLLNIPKTGGFAERVRDRLTEELRGGDATVKQLARRMKMSPRTLRRRLEDENQTFQALLDELRHGLALAYLEEPGIGAEQAAFLLGFSEASAFRRAFKRWTGESIVDYRKSRLEQVPAKPAAAALVPRTSAIELDSRETDFVQVQHGLSFAWDYACQRSDLRALYENGREAAWNARTAFAWDTHVDPTAESVPDRLNPLFGTPLWAKLDPKKDIPELRRQQRANVLSGFLHGEQGSLLLSAQLVEAAPTLDAKICAAAQVSDEARHVEVFERYLREKVGVVYPISRAQRELLDVIFREPRWDFKFLGMQIMIEGLALGAMGMLQQSTNEPLLKRIAQYVAQDERRHVAFGLLALKDIYGDMSAGELREREEFVLFSTALIHQRFLGEDVWERVGLPRKECEEAVKHSATLQVFRQMCFSKIVPNIKRVGLLTPKVRKLFEELGIIQYEIWQADA